MLNIENPEKSGKKDNTSSSAPGSNREQNQRSILSDLASFNTLVPTSKEHAEYKIEFDKILRQQLISRNLKSEKLLIHDITAETNGLNFLYIEYIDDDKSFAFCIYFEEFYNKADSFIADIGINTSYQENTAFGNFNMNNNMRNIETMDERCKDSIKFAIQRNDAITIKVPYMTNAIDKYSYNRAGEHAQNIVKQIASIYSIRDPESFKLTKALPRNVKINAHYIHGEKVRNIMTSLYPNSIIPRCDIALIATGTDMNKDEYGNQGSPQPLGVVTGYIDFVQNNIQQQYNLYSGQQQGRYTPIFKVTSVINCGRLPFMSLLMIAYAYEFFCDRGNWHIHMHEDYFLHNFGNIGNLFFKEKENENSKNEIMVCKNSAEVDRYINPNSGCFTQAVIALEIIDSHFTDPILKLIDLNDSQSLLNYLRQFTEMTIADDSLPSLIFEQTTNIVGTITKNPYNKNENEIDSRYLSTYLDLILQFPSAINEEDLKLFMFSNNANSIRKTNYIEKKTGGNFDKKFKCNNSILHPSFIRLMAEIVSKAGINFHGDNSHSGNPNMNNGSLNFNNDFFANLNNIPSISSPRNSFNVQNSNPFISTPFSN